MADVRSSFPKHPDPVFSAAPSRVCVCVCQLESEPASQQPQLGEAAGRDCAVRLLLAKRGGCAVWKTQNLRQQSIFGFPRTTLTEKDRGLDFQGSEGKEEEEADICGEFSEALMYVHKAHPAAMSWKVKKHRTSVFKIELAQYIMC